MSVIAKQRSNKRMSNKRFLCLLDTQEKTNRRVAVKHHRSKISVSTRCGRVRKRLRSWALVKSIELPGLMYSQQLLGKY